MNNKEAMFRKTLIYFAGNFSSKIFSVLIIPIYAIYLNAHELGEYDFQITVASLLGPIMALAIWEAILRFGLSSSDAELKQIISTSFFVSLTTLSISFLFLYGLYANLYGSNLNTILYTVMIILNPLVTIFGYMTRALKKSGTYAIAGVTGSFVNILMICCFVVYFKLGLTGLLISTVTANFFNCCYLFFGGKIYLFIDIKNFSLTTAKKMISFSSPLILNLVFGWLISSFTRFYINLSMGPTENGIYAFAMKFSMILMQFSSIINMIMIEDAVESLGSKNWLKRFERNIETVTNIFFRLTFLLLPLIGIYYHTVKNSDFQKSLSFVPILMFVILINNSSTMIGNIFSVYNKTSKVFFTTLLGGILNIGFAVVFGQFFGLIGIVIAQLFGASALLISRYFMGQNIEKYNLNFLNIFFNVILYIIISYIVLQKNIIMQIGVFLIVFMFISYLYKNSLNNLITKFKKSRGKI